MKGWNEICEAWVNNKIIRIICEIRKMGSLHNLWDNVDYLWDIDGSTASLLPQSPCCYNSIDQTLVSAVDIYKILIHLDISKATGLDGISNRLLKEAAVPVGDSLSHLFNLSLSNGIFPDIWKTANINLVFKKKADPMECTNYHHIS